VRLVHDEGRRPGRLDRCQGVGTNQLFGRQEQVLELAPFESPERTPACRLADAVTRLGGRAGVGIVP